VEQKKLSDFILNVKDILSDDVAREILTFAKRNTDWLGGQIKNGSDAFIFCLS